MEVFWRFLRPWPANFCASAVTTQTSHTGDFTVKMPASKKLIPPVPPQLPTETEVPWTTHPRRLLALVIDRLPCIIFGVFIGVLVYHPKIITNGKCVVPAYPEHGTYNKHNPGESFESLRLPVTCDDGYGVSGKKIVYCHDGSWSDPIPQCIRFCKLDKDPSVHYYCPIPGSTECRRVCNAYEPEGTVVKPECISPIYYSTATLGSMRCINGSWDSVAMCSLDCGRIIQKLVPLVTNGRSAKHGELPWHVGIYRKTTTPYEQICGGSIITNSLVFSAAHCFWDDLIKLRPASEYAVAAGKIYRPWNNPRDVHAQKSDVKDIKIPVGFQGGATSFQADIAVIILETLFVYKLFVGPICLHFDAEFDKTQLQPGKLGKVGGWGLTAENSKLPSQILKVIDLPYYNLTECYAALPPDFKVYITTDKICAGYKNGTALCRGDSGGGLAFCDLERGKLRCYLRGIVSTAPNNDKYCNSKTLTTFTHILQHEHFVREYV